MYKNKMYNKKCCISFFMCLILGFSKQWITNGGKCGICGDPFDAPQVY